MKKLKTNITGAGRKRECENLLRKNADDSENLILFK